MRIHGDIMPHCYSRPGSLCSNETLPGYTSLPPPKAGSAGRSETVALLSQVGETGVMHECCFCSQPLPESGPDVLAFVVSAADPSNEVFGPTQQLWCHGSCLGGRLASTVPFDTSVFSS